MFFAGRLGIRDTARIAALGRREIARRTVSSERRSTVMVIGAGHLPSPGSTARLLAPIETMLRILCDENHREDQKPWLTRPTDREAVLLVILEVEEVESGDEAGL